MRADKVLKIFSIALGRYSKGHKLQEGDARTPEGSYILDKKLRDSQFYRAIRISYPNELISPVLRHRVLSRAVKL